MLTTEQGGERQEQGGRRVQPVGPRTEPWSSQQRGPRAQSRQRKDPGKVRGEREMAAHGQQTGPPWTDFRLGKTHGSLLGWGSEASNWHRGGWAEDKQTQTQWKDPRVQGQAENEPTPCPSPTLPLKDCHVTGLDSLLLWLLSFFVFFNTLLCPAPKTFGTVVTQHCPQSQLTNPCGDPHQLPAPRL